MDQEILEKSQAWADDDYFSEEFRNEIKILLDENNEDELTDRFYKDLEFGTGGLRGILGAGSNRMNIYTVRKATQGLADYILKQTQKTKEDPSVAIAYDSRIKSDVFSREAACVLAASGIKVHLYRELRPVPMLSFAVRELKTTAGIVITASHNPSEYNGYKVYWSDGCQVVSPHDTGIIERVNAISDFSEVKEIAFETAKERGMIQMIPESLERTYFDKVSSLSLGDKNSNKEFGVVYTPLHGAGNFPVREILRRRGFEKIRIVKPQEKADGNFPTVASPNPEEPTALQMAVEIAGKDDYLVMGTDPDADRLGVMVKHQETWHKINGNQIGQLMLEYYLDKMKKLGKLPDDGVYITTIVTSGLGQEIADDYGVKTVETLTGFKYIGSIVRDMEEKKTGTFIFGTEESHGYLFSHFVRDKDGVIASMIFAELCAELHSQGMTPIDKLNTIHQKYSFHADSLVNKVIKGQSGAQKISEIMSFLRGNPPKSIAGVEVQDVKDYDKKQIIDCQTGEIKGEIDMPQSNVLAFYMKDGSRITARPSGTEPKIKFYFNLCGDSEEALKSLKQAYENDFAALIESI